MNSKKRPLILSLNKGNSWSVSDILKQALELMGISDIEDCCDCGCIDYDEK